MDLVPGGPCSLVVKLLLHADMKYEAKLGGGGGSSQNPSLFWPPAWVR